MRKKHYREYPERCCYTLLHCDLCNKSIKAGQLYFDGGGKCRAHKDCVLLMEKQTGVAM